MSEDPEAGLRRRLLARTAQDVHAMRAALGRGDFASIAALAHRLRGAAGALGEDDLAQLGREIDGACRAADGEAVAAGVERLERRVRGA